jgi:hypothetical protein
MAKSQTITQFDDAARRRIAAVVRRVEGTTLPKGKKDARDGGRGLQVRFGITVVHESAYPSDPATVFNWKPVDRKPAALTVGDQAISDTPWEEGIRKGVSIDGGYIAEGILCKVYKIGGTWWLEPFPGVLSGTTSGALTARGTTTPGSGTVIVKNLGGPWEAVQVDEEDLTVTVKSVYTSEVASGKAVTFARDALTGLYLLLGADC